MKTSCWAALALLAMVVAPRAGAQQTGSIEFVARVAPTDGRPEPVRQMTFYLLRKSFAEIRKEAEQSEPAPELDRFVDSLEISKELKAWMKKRRSTELAGADFIRRLRVDDILQVPEFYDAYLQRNSGDPSLGFPTPKYRESDRQRDPQKYEKLRAEFNEAVGKFLEANPQSVDGMDVHLEAINPAQRWAQQQIEYKAQIRRGALKLAQTRYLAGRADSDLEGRGSFASIAPGEYWLGTLMTEAITGDARLRWNLPVTVRAGQTTRVELSNLNALEEPRPAR